MRAVVRSSGVWCLVCVCIFCGYVDLLRAYWNIWYTFSRTTERTHIVHSRSQCVFFNGNFRFNSHSQNIARAPLFSAQNYATAQTHGSEQHTVPESRRDQLKLPTHVHARTRAFVCVLYCFVSRVRARESTRSTRVRLFALLCTHAISPRIDHMVFTLCDWGLTRAQQVACVRPAYATCAARASACARFSCA